MTRPTTFTWGTATSAFQIEGALDRDGRGRSIWDDFQDHPGAIANGDQADGASHHYDHWKDDVALLNDLGVDAYRFSVAWPRVIPDGTGKVNDAGLGFYDRLVDGLLEAGIEPVVTLYHWDLPSALQMKGGWVERATAEAFAEYARVVVDALGDRVTRWITHNEPQAASLAGHAAGVHAPGDTDIKTALQVAHGLLVSHGLAVDVIHDAVPDAKVGITLDVNAVAPADPEDPDHVRAAQLWDGQTNRWFLDPVFGQGYPVDVLAYYRTDAPDAERGDLDVIGAPIDFLGVNYYRLETVEPADEDDWRAARVVERDVPRTAMGWEISPDGLYDALHRVCDGYGAPEVQITENGAAFDDHLEHGHVHDDERIEYLVDHLAQVERCVEEGLPITGYYLWSLVDNFEWAEGFSKRFGIVWSEPDQYVRVPKDSFTWYRDHIQRSRGRHENVDG